MRTRDPWACGSCRPPAPHRRRFLRRVPTPRDRRERPRSRADANTALVQSSAGKGWGWSSRTRARPLTRTERGRRLPRPEPSRSGCRRQWTRGGAGRSPPRPQRRGCPVVLQGRSSACVSGSRGRGSGASQLLPRWPPRHRSPRRVRTRRRRGRARRPRQVRPGGRSWETEGSPRPSRTPRP